MHARMSSRTRRRSVRLAAAIAIAATAIALGIPGGTSSGDAADRYVAGGPVTDRIPVAADQAATTLALAEAARSSLSLPEAASTRVERVVDRFSGTTYDEVTAIDRTGRAIHLERFDPSGRLIGAVAFGWDVGGAKPMTDVAAARDRGDKLAADLGLNPSGTPDVRPAADDAGWTLTWPRVVEGVPVMGDGVRIDLWPDGRMHAIVRTERPLAPRPVVTIGEASARGRASATLVKMFGTRSGQLRIASLGLGWVAPNNAFDPTAPDAPGATLRLAWVAEARATGGLADGLRAVRLYLDAGTGSLIGGDVLR